jgi:hypothetical protein
MRVKANAAADLLASSIPAPVGLPSFSDTGSPRDPSRETQSPPYGVVSGGQLGCTLQPTSCWTSPVSGSTSRKNPIPFA